MDPPLNLERLRADCGSCFGLCCVALPLVASADFAIDKAAGAPCPHLAAQFRCDIHDRLRPSGFPGCSAYDCFGAGQHVAQVTFRGRDWRTAPETAPLMMLVFPIVRHLHELLWFLVQAREYGQGDPDLADAIRTVDDLTRRGAEDLAAVDVDRVRAEVNVLLQRTSERVRAEFSDAPRLRGADLVGTDLRRRRLRGADLRGALLLGADLRGVDLALADLRGADLRGADLRGAALARALFLTQTQVASATGDARTALPDALLRPSHWASAERRRAAPGRPAR